MFTTWLGVKIEIVGDKRIGPTSQLFPLRNSGSFCWLVGCRAPCLPDAPCPASLHCRPLTRCSLAVARSLACCN